MLGSQESSDSQRQHFLSTFTISSIETGAELNNNSLECNTTK